MARRPILLLLLVVALPAGAETYRWEDANGIHYSENLASVPAAKREKARKEVGRDITTRNPEVKESVDRLRRRNAEREWAEKREAVHKQLLQNAANADKKRNDDLESWRQKLRDPKREYDNWKPSYHRLGSSPARVRRR